MTDAELRSSSAAYPSPARAWTILVLLSFAYVSAFIDRQLLALLVEPIQRDLGISDTQFGLLGGAAFALFYTTMGLVIGRLVDSRQRVRLVAAGIAAWSLACAACGVAKSFGQLFLARVGVGVGEAVLMPSAYSLIPDSFPPSRLGRALGIYMAAAGIGAGIAFLLGGAVVSLVADAQPLDLPGFGQIHAWQQAFFIAALLGLPISILMFLVPEPPRYGTKLSGTAALPLRDVAGFIRANLNVYARLSLGFSGMGILFYAIATWIPAFLIRRFDFEASEAGYLLGVILATLGPLGTILGGIAADRWATARRPGGHLAIPIAGAALVTIFGGLLGFASSPTMAALLIAGLIFAVALPLGVAPATIQLITPGTMRGQVASLDLFVSNVLGIGLGPVIPALLTDYLFGDPASVGLSLSLMGCLFGPITFLILLSAVGPFRAAMARTDAEAAR